ncbi:hypothetical protein [Corynebacterium sp.]|uniref:hypothetical protein n=1 Tax=Corynebacterium sp. TaxID=1720 RepID=UPI0026E112F0|nr:hypothetical protein [Corynebacterium sp.]MDO5512872.1 hypothetical protein [Corynebacterium sp.]
MLRRSLATVAAAGIALTGLAAVAPAAQAQDINRLIGAAPCELVDPVLRSTFNINADTTRSGLTKQIREAARPVTGTDPAAFLLGAQYANQIADRAVACGVVKEDPQLFPGSSIPGLENIPNITEIQDILQGLSSTLQPR